MDGWKVLEGVGGQRSGKWIDGGVLTPRAGQYPAAHISYVHTTRLIAHQLLVLLHFLPLLLYHLHALASCVQEVCLTELKRHETPGLSQCEEQTRRTHLREGYRPERESARCQEASSAQGGAGHATAGRLVWCESGV